MRIPLRTARVLVGAAACAGLTLAGIGLTFGQGAPTKLTIMTGLPQGAPTTAVYWIGRALGFQTEENIDADVLTVPQGNMAQGVQLVASGQANAVMTSIESVVVPASQGKDTGLTFVYNFFQRPQWRFLVASDSGIKSVADLKGKVVGTPVRGVPADPIMKAFLATGGLSMNDVTIQSVGVEIPAAQALKSGQISALLTVSLASANWESAGFIFTALPEPKEFDDLIGAAVAVPRTTLKDPAKREAIVRFLRSWARSAVFVKANPEAAIKINYELFPAAKPRGVSDAEAIKRGMAAQASVSQSYTTNVGGRWGAFRPNTFQKYIEFLNIQVPDVNALWTNELSDEINKFDEKEVAQKAMNYK